MNKDAALSQALREGEGELERRVGRKQSTGLEGLGSEQKPEEHWFSD